MSRYTPPKSSGPEPERGPFDSLAPMRRRRPVVFWVVIIGVVAMVAATVSSFLTLLLT